MRYIVIIFFSLLPIVLLGQGTAIPYGYDAYHIIDRLDIKFGYNESRPFTALKYYSRKEATLFAMAIDNDETAMLSIKDRGDLQYLFNESNEWLAGSEGFIGSKYNRAYVDSSNTFYTVQEPDKWENDNYRFEESRRPIFNRFYKTPANFYEIFRPSFTLKANPVLHLKAGSVSNDDKVVFQNIRGFRVRGGIDDKVWFYTSVIESQARFQKYIVDNIKANDAIMGSGFYKNYTSSILNVNDGYDFLNAQGYFAFQATKHIALEFGHGRHFIGNGYRSFILSDVGNNYLYLKANTRVWKFNYQNLFTELTSAYRSRGRQRLLPKKYMALHHLSIDLLPFLNIGIFEAVVFNRDKRFELQYLNPIIFYRTAEQALGSPDNTLAGIDWKFNFLKRFSFYGQAVIDEFLFYSLFGSEQKGSRNNKYAFQLGLKYIDVAGISHLDLQLEHNIARPYMYTHRDSTANYSHFNQPLAHPLGANFKEYLAMLRYQPIQALTLKAKVLVASNGTDTLGTNWGGDIFISNSRYERAYNNVVGQGVGNNIMIASLIASYQLKHNLYVDLEYTRRQFDSVLNGRDLTTNYFGLGVRLNIADRPYDF